MSSHILIFSFFVSLIINIIAIRAIIPFLISRKFVDLPNERSSHSNPTPKGAGIIIVTSFVIMWHLAFGLKFWYLGISLCITCLALVSLINDRKSLTPILRLFFQMIVVSFFLYIWFYAPYGNETQSYATFNLLLPIGMQLILIFFLILWFINLFNFMDGIDGISGAQCIIIGFGSLISSFFSGLESDILFFLSGFLVGSGMAFLFWNWNPAKVFLGDVGSIPLGLINIILIMVLCVNNLWFSAFFLCNYYVIDSTTTLFKRFFKKKPFWEAHKEHCYQIAIQNGKSHSNVCIAIGFHGVMMIVFASISSYFQSNTIITLCLILSILSTIVLIYYFLGKRRKPINE